LGTVRVAFDRPEVRTAFRPHTADELYRAQDHARMTRRCEADFIMLLGMLAEASPRAPVIGVICDNDSSCHTRAVTSYLEKHPRLEGLYGARYSPHLGGAEELRGEHRRELAGPSPPDPRPSSQPLTRPDAGHRRALDQPWLLPGYECRRRRPPSRRLQAPPASFLPFRRRPGPGSSHPGEVTARMYQVETRVSHRADQHPMMLRVIAHCLFGRCRRE
jgi:hypothetical protein